MPNIVVIDESVIEQLNQGNRSLASQLQNYRAARAEIWMTRETYRQLSRVPANERLLNDFGVRVPAVDVPLAREWQPMYGSHKNGNTAALAIDRKAAVMTANAELKTIFKAQGRMLFDFNAIEQSGGWGNPDYNRSRRLLGLGELNITPNGQIVWRPPSDTTAQTKPGPKTATEPEVK